MKFFVAFAALVALTVAVPLGKPVNSDLDLLESIVAAINSPSTDPATAALLEEQLAGIINAINPIDISPVIVPEETVVEPEPISVGPAIVPEDIVIQPEPVSIGPALVPPKPDGGAVVGPVVPSPVVVGDIPVGTSPLVQIIVNVNNAAPVEAVPVVRPEPVATIPIEPVHVVDEAPEPVQVVEVAPEPVQVVEVAPEHIEGSEDWPVLAPGHVEISPVQVVEVAPVPVEPVQIGVPVLPEAAVILPEQLN